MSEQPQTALATTSPRQTQLSRGINVLALPFDQLWNFCTAISKTDIGKSFKNDPATTLIAMQFGAELNLSWAQSLSSIMVVNGKASIYGDSMLGICKAQPDWSDKDFKETVKDEKDGGRTAYCQCKRGDNVYLRSFSEKQAIKAELWGKDIWKKYPDRMLQMRARSWALRDAFPDVLKGLLSTEEAFDVPGPMTQIPSATLVDAVRSAIPAVVDAPTETIHVYPADIIDAQVEAVTA